MVIALVGILFWALRSRLRTSATKRTFAWFITAISLAISTLIFSVINFFVLGLASYAVLVFIALFSPFQYLADATLLAAIFTYIIPRSAFARSSAPTTRTNAHIRLHLFFCGLLIAIWFAITALGLATVIKLFQSDRHDVYSILGGYGVLMIIFNVLYLPAALEICCLAIMALTSSRKLNNNNSRNDQQSLLFLALIGAPLLVRQVFELPGTFVTEDANFQIARQVVYFVCTTIIYAGLVLLMKNISRKPFSNRNPYGNAKDGGNGLELGAMSPDEPIMRVPAPVEDQTGVAPPEPVEKPVWSRRAAEDHWSPPSYSGP
ncbi:MAG: hypothetical protein Q9221_001484 [Calogaya cf. arnoldii]